MKKQIALIIAASFVFIASAAFLVFDFNSRSAPTPGNASDNTANSSYEKPVELSKKSVSLSVQKGQSEKLKAKISSGQNQQSVSWSSSNPKAVTVDENGKITAIGLGCSVIRASAGENYDECTVTTYLKGECGDDMYWQLENGVLSISGKGNMYNYTPLDPAPWQQYREYISDVSLKGMSSIGSYAFYGCAYLAWVTVPKTVTYIGDWAFSGCDNIRFNVTENSFSQQFAVKNDIPYNIYTVKGSVSGGDTPAASDLMRLKNMIKKPYAASSAESSQDINNDGKINITDFIYLLGFIKKNKYDDELSRSVLVSIDNLRYTANNSNEINTLAGIDVSKYQNNINWASVKKSRIDFAFIRIGYRGCTEGALKDDEMFEKNVRNAVACNIPFGVYFFTQAINTDEAIAEADYVIEKIKNYPVKMPIAFDIEDLDFDGKRTENMTNEQRTAIAKAFCQRVKERGFFPIIYSNLNFFKDSLNMSELSEYQIWLANYKGSTPGMDFSVWQYSNTGRVKGISTAVDLNLSVINYPVYLKNYGYW